MSVQEFGQIALEGKAINSQVRIEPVITEWRDHLESGEFLDLLDESDPDNQLELVANIPRRPFTASLHEHLLRWESMSLGRTG